MPTSAFAADELDYRAQVLQEVLNALNGKDTEIAEQLVDIRLEQEQKLGIQPYFKLFKIDEGSSNSKSINSKYFESKKSVNSFKTVTEYPIEGTKDFYTSVGNRFIIGYSFGKTEDYGFRTEVSGSSKSDANKIVDGTTYDYYHKNTSISSYLDWYPFRSNFRLTSGLNVNDMRTKLIANSNRKININSSQVSLGANTFNVELKFPVFSPYVGFGFINRKIDSLGFSYFGDLGLIMGKYNAIATTTMIGSQNITSSDVDAELNNIRKSLNKYSFVPIASFGLTYRYQ